MSRPKLVRNLISDLLDLGAFMFGSWLADRHTARHARTTSAELVSLARHAINQFETEVGSSEAGRYIDDHTGGAEWRRKAVEK